MQKVIHVFIKDGIKCISTYHVANINELFNCITNEAATATLLVFYPELLTGDEFDLLNLI